MVNDLNTLSGALIEMKDQLIYELGQKGVTASYSSTTGLLGLIGKISEIQQGGSCYHIKFSEDSYTAVGGSVTLECTLQQNYAPLANATVTLTDGNSLYYSMTDSNGVATFNLTGLSSSGTYTCSYSNVSDSCTITVVSYLFYDDCTTDMSSQYGTVHQLKSNASVTLTYDSTNTRYTIGTNGVDGFCDIPIPVLDNLNNYFVEAEFYTTDTSTGGQCGLVVYPTADTTKNGVMFRDIASINRCGVLKFVSGNENGEAGNSVQSNLPVANNWIKVRLEVNGTHITGKWLKTDGTLIYSYTYTVPYTSGAMRVGLAFLPKSTSKPYYMRNIKAESIQIVW